MINGFGTGLIRNVIAIRRVTLNLGVSVGIPYPYAFIKLYCLIPDLTTLIDSVARS